MAIPVRPLLYRSLFAIALLSFLTTAILPGVAFGLPLVAITRPTQGATVSGIIWIDVAFRSDSNRAITRLEVYIDDALAREVDLASPLLEGRQSFNWDFTYAANTVHKISARAIDSGGNANTAAITVSVQNATVGGPDRIPPVVRIYYPAQGAKLRGAVEIKAEAQDNVGVELVYFYIDGKLHKMMMQAPPYVDLWDTTREADGNHVLEAVAVDAAENEARSAQVTVIVENHAMTLAASGTAGATGTALPTLPVLPVAPVAPPVSAAPTASPSATTTAVAPPVGPSLPLGPVAVVPPAPAAPAPPVVLPATGGPAQINRAGNGALPVAAADAGPRVGSVAELTAPGTAPSPSRPVTAGPLLTAGSQPATPAGPRVAMVTPRAQALEPVPAAPTATSLTLAPEAPVSVRTSRPANVSTPPVVGTPTAPKTVTLTRPGLSTLRGPAPDDAAVLTKTSGTGLAPALAPAANPRPAVASATPPTPQGPVATAREAKPLAPRPSSTTLPSVASASLSPLTSNAPQPSGAWQPSALPAKSSVAAPSVPPARPALPRGEAAASATPAKPVTPEPVRVAHPGLAPLNATNTVSPAPHQSIVPVGPPATALPRAINVAPLMVVTPGSAKAAPSLQPRLASPPPVAPGKTVAALTRPTVSPATIVRAALTAAGDTPIAAARMLARLPEPSEFGQLPADGRLAKPTATAAVPLAVAKVRDIKIIFDGEVLTLRTAPETRRGLSLAPLREIFEHTDGVLYWFPVEKQVRAVNKSVDMKLSIGNPKVQVNGVTKVLEVAPYIKQGRTMIPLQFIAETLDVAITFDSQTGNILIASNQQ